MKIEFFLDVQPGEVWVNDQGYKLKVLDIDPQGTELWLEWGNGRKGSWTPTKFIEARYRLYSHSDVVYPTPHPADSEKEETKP